MEPADDSHVLESSLLLVCNIVLGIIFFSGIAANFLVILVFYRKPGLRTTANRFVINLMIINIVACVSLLPIELIDNSILSADNNYLCFAEQFSSIFCSSAIVYSVLLIAIDQYFAVVDPLHYHCIISSCKGHLMIVSSWVFSIVLALLGVIQPDFEVFHSILFRQCRAQVEEDLLSRNNSNSSAKNSFSNSLKPEAHINLYRNIFSASYVTAAFIVPFGLICFIYYRICAAASGNSKRTRTSILTSDDNTPKVRSKFNSENSESEKTFEELTSIFNDKNSVKSESLLGDQMETYSLLKSDECSLKPSFVVTRPSPPKLFLGDNEIKKTERNNASKSEKVPKSNDNSSHITVESEVPFLKPTLKNNSSFSKLSSLHIQFSNSTEKIGEIRSNSNERRHSNIPLPVLDPDFENISKNRSSSMQSNFCDIASRSSSSRSTTVSIQMQSSRSSSLNYTCTRHPPSRASSIRSTSSCIVHNIKHRISNASLFRYREEARAARISAMVIVMTLFCWLPFFSIFLLRSGMCWGNYSSFSHYFDAFSIVFLLFSTVVSPFLFAFRNRQIKKEIRKIFELYPENLTRNFSKSFYRHNFSLSLKTQTVHLFNEINTQSNIKKGVNEMGPMKS